MVDIDTGIEIYREPIEKALDATTNFRLHMPRSFAGISLEFDPEVAAELEPISEASEGLVLRSASEVRHQGAKFGRLIVVALGPEQIVGDGSTPVATSSEVHADILPPLGENVVHLPIYTHKSQEPRQPRRFLNTLEMLRVISDGKMTGMGHLGSPPSRFERAMAQAPQVTAGNRPQASLTTGYNMGEGHFDAPNAVRNPYDNAVQVSGFLAISPRIVSVSPGLLYRLPVSPGLRV